MKKLFLLSIFTFILGYSLTSQALTAEVLSVSGKVEVFKDSAWKTVSTGDKLSRGDIISTGFNSEAVLSVKDSKLKLAALTRMTIEQLAENEKKEQAQFFLDSGKVSASVKHAENKRTDFKVRSPVSTASVRGTDFDIYSTGKIHATDGMVASSKSTSDIAQVEDSDTPSDFLPEESSSSVFTSTKKVAEGSGIPVFAGQTTVADETTGSLVAPQVQVITETQDVQGYTAATGNSAADSGLAIINTTTNTSSGGDSAKSNATGSLSVEINLVLGN